MKIVLLGNPGAGKDTLADQFRLKYNYMILSPGKIFRKEAERGSALGLRAKNEYWGKGLLCPNDITNALVKDTLENLTDKEKAGIIFNGFPRSVIQAKYLNDIVTINMAIELDITEDIAINRLMSRNREDDTAKIIKERFKEYKEKTLPITDFYRKMIGCQYIWIDSDAKPEYIFEEAVSYVSDYIAKC